MDKQIEKQLKEYSKLKGAALREAYAEVVGRDTNETSRERLLNGIARVLIHDAEQAKAKAAEDAKAKAKKEKTSKKASKEPKDAEPAADASSGGTQAPADNAVVVCAGADTAADVTTAPNGPDNASHAGDGGSAVADASDTIGVKRRGPSRTPGERDPRLPPAGTVLEKVYQGTVYRVTLLQDNGCLYNGKQYRSLSGLAKELTGTNHSVAGRGTKTVVARKPRFLRARR